MNGQGEEPGRQAGRRRQEGGLGMVSSQGVRAVGLGRARGCKLPCRVEAEGPLLVAAWAMRFRGALSVGAAGDAIQHWAGSGRRV